MFDLNLYNSLNYITAFTSESNGVFSAEGFYNGTVKIYVTNRFENSTQEFLLTKHGAPITDIKFNIIENPNVEPINGVQLYTASFDQKVCVWNMKHNKWVLLQEQDYSEHNKYCTEIAVNAEGINVFLSFSDGSLANFYDAVHSSSKVDDHSICVCANPLSDGGGLIVGTAKGNIKFFDDDIKLKKKKTVSKVGIVYLDITDDQIVATCEDHSIIIINKISLEHSHIEQTIRGKDFRPAVAKFDPVTDELYVLSDDGKMLTLVKTPDEKYRSCE